MAISPDVNKNVKNRFILQLIFFVKQCLLMCEDYKNKYLHLDSVIVIQFPGVHPLFFAWVVNKQLYLL